MDLMQTARCPFCDAPARVGGEYARHVHDCERIEAMSLGERLQLSIDELSPPVYTEQLASPEPPEAARRPRWWERPGTE